MQSATKDRRRRLLALEIERTALQLFADRGYDAVTVEQIADHAGISSRTFYRYFPKKADILRARGRRQIELLCDALADRPPSERLFDALEGALEDLGDGFFRQDEEEEVLWVRAATTAPVFEFTTLSEDWGKLRKLLAGVIAKRISPPVDGDLYANLAAGILNEALLVAYTRWFESGARGLLGHEVIATMRALRNIHSL